MYSKLVVFSYVLHHSDLKFTDISRMLYTIFIWKLFHFEFICSMSCHLLYLSLIFSYPCTVSNVLQQQNTNFLCHDISFELLWPTTLRMLTYTISVSFPSSRHWLYLKGWFCIFCSTFDSPFPSGYDVKRWTLFICGPRESCCPILNWYFLTSDINGNFNFAVNVYKVLSVRIRMQWLCTLCRRLRPTPKMRCLGYDTKLYLMVRLQMWRSKECWVPLHCHYSQVHSESEW